MKILHCNTHDAAGGAAIAARRLHRALRDAGEDSYLAVARKHEDSSDTVLVGGKLVRRVVQPALFRLEREILEVCYTRPPSPAYTTFSFFPSLQHRRINALSKDILHLHWIGEGFLSPWSLAKLQGPVVWTMHDTWPFTGGCHYPSENCYRYFDRCGQCPELCSRQNMDISRIHWKIKRRAVKKVQPTIIALSQAFVQMVKQSGILRDCRVEHIPNCIDSNLFRPLSQESAREALGLPQRERIVLFGAPSATSDHRKGFDLLQDALKQVVYKTHGNFLAVVFGSAQSESALPCETQFLGHLHDAVSLKLAYSAADVFVCPSRQESFSNTVLESLACGTPVAAFSIGGIPDMVEHKVNGWLAPPQDTEALAQGIAYILEDAERRARMSEAARRVVEERYAAPVVAARYRELYSELLEATAKP